MPREAQADRQRRGIHAALLSICLLVIACSGETGDAGEAAAGGVVSDFQADILEDGEVTFGEFESAVGAYSACLEELGIAVEAEYSDTNESFDYAFSLPGGDVGAALDTPEAVECHDQYVSRVELVWADQVGPTAEEERAFYEAIAECMRAQGFEVADAEPQTLGFWSDQQPDEYSACFEEAIVVTE